MEPVELPTMVDEPMQFLLWSSDEVIPLGAAMMLGIIIERVLIFMAIGWIFTSVYRRFKNSKPDGYLAHWFYWLGLIPTKCKPWLNPYMRRWYP